MAGKNARTKHKLNNTAKKQPRFVNCDKKYSYFSRIYQNFCDWLVGIQEDDPLPFETKNIYFIVEFGQNDIAFSYSADDRYLQIFDYGSYFPLEAQYFYCDCLSILSKELFLEKSISKNFVLDMLRQIVSKASLQLSFLHNRHIFIGERFSDVCV